MKLSSKAVHIRVVIDDSLLNSVLAENVGAGICSKIEPLCAQLGAYEAIVVLSIKEFGPASVEFSERVVDVIHDQYDGIAHLRCALEINLVELNGSWINLARRRGMALCVKLQPHEVHSMSFHRLEGGGALASLSSDQQGNGIAGLSAVIQIERGANVVPAFDYLVDVLGVRVIDVQVVAVNDSISTDYGFVMGNIFKNWLSRNDPDLVVVPFDVILGRLGRGSEERSDDSRLAICVFEYKPQRGIDFALSAIPNLGGDSSAASAFGSDLAGLEEVIRRIVIPPLKCSGCCWWQVCGGGHYSNRVYSDVGVEPSHICDGLQKMFLDVFSHLASRGVPQEELMSRLRIAESKPTDGRGV